MDKKSVKLITSDKTVDLTDDNRFIYLDYVEEDVQQVNNSLEVKGSDGVLPSATSFGPFNLELKFIYSGVDFHDYHLFKSKLRETIYQRQPYYIWHSDMPGVKYAVLPDSTEIEDIYGRNGEVNITFQVYKGYSESYLSTDDMKLSNLNDWQFGNGYLAFDETDDFHHRTKKFRIYNGSSDAIDPTLRHTLNITVHANAPKGFKIRSLTTGDVFEYTGSLVYTDTFMLKGVYPVKNGSRVGAETNMSWLTLNKGFNYFVVEGEGLSDFDITFSFNFIYR